MNGFFDFKSFKHDFLFSEAQAECEALCHGETGPEEEGG